MNVAGDVLSDQYARGHNLWPFFADIEAEFGLPAFLLWAIGSKETGLRPEYAEGKVHDDGHGWGLFGADDRWNDLDLPAFAGDPAVQARLAAATLSANRQRLGNWPDAVNAYGPKAGRPAYGADVLERAGYLAEHAEGPAPMTPVDIIRAAMADLEAEGFEVEFEDGWEDRTVGGAFAPAGFLWHHTATSAAAAGDYPSRRIVRDGVDQGGGYFLPGPLSQFGGARTGTIIVIAAGKANHAGPGGWNGLVGNSSVWGLEMENNGIGEPWRPRQVEAGVALAAALGRHGGFGAESCCRHAEWSAAGKIDTATAPMDDGDWLRAQVAARLAGAPPAPQPPPVPQEVPTLFIFDGPQGGIYATDGDKKWGVPSGAYLDTFFFNPNLNGRVPHLGTMPQEAFDALRDRHADEGGVGIPLAGPIESLAPAAASCAGE